MIDHAKAGATSFELVWHITSFSYTNTDPDIKALKPIVGLHKPSHPPTKDVAFYFNKFIDLTKLVQKP